MRIAIFSDVHGNRFALEAVLKDIESVKPDAIANLGDQIWGSGDPAGAWKLQQEIGAVMVRGNTDEFLSYEDKEFGPALGFVQWLRNQLPSDSAAQLMQLPIVQTIGDEVVVAHSNLKTPHEALFDTKETANIPIAEVTQQMLDQLASYPKAKVVVVGHTHTEVIATHEGITFVNAGAVSRQKDGDPAARWVLLEKRWNRWSVSFRRVEYDLEAAVRWTLAHIPEADKEALANNLRTGKR